jgi:hypothetical protein
MILLACLTCRQRYWAGSVESLLYRSCLCGGILRCL